MKLSRHLADYRLRFVVNTRCMFCVLAALASTILPESAAHAQCETMKVVASDAAFGDNFGLIVDYKVMEGGSETGEVVPSADRLLRRFGEGNIWSLSYDKGFSSVADRELLELFFPEVCFSWQLQRKKKVCLGRNFTLKIPFSHLLKRWPILIWT